MTLQFDDVTVKTIYVLLFFAWFSRDDFRELNHRKQLIPRKSLKAVYERTVISNNAPRNVLLYSKNISSKFITVSSDPRITDLRGGTWHLHVNHISSIKVPWDLVQL